MNDPLDLQRLPAETPVWPGLEQPTIPPTHFICADFDGAPSNPPATCLRLRESQEEL